MSEESEFLKHEPCPNCGSKDNLGRYTDGHGYCFGCGHHEQSEESGGEVVKLTEVSASNRQKSQGLLSKGQAQALPKRRLREDTCKKYGYTVSEFNGRPVQVANYYSPDRKLVAQKVRGADKKFWFFGDTDKCGLFGQHLWGDQKDKPLVITEGEIDCLSVSQVRNNAWPVVSIYHGAQGASRAIRKHIDWISGFGKVIFMFDMDEAGQSAAVECAKLLRPGQAFIASLPLKDPNEMLQAGRAKELVSAIFEAQPYRPDGIISGSDLWDDLIHEEPTYTVKYPWETMNKMTRGLRAGELTVFTAGSGIGKSAIVREIAYDLINKGETVGMLMLEESVKKTAWEFISLHMNRRISISGDKPTEEELKPAFDATVGSGRLFMYDHFGSVQIDNLLDRVRYMAVACECKWIILDHLSIVVSGLGDGDERRLIDNAMTHLRSLVEETGVGLVLVSHLRRPEGKGHEEGASTSLSQLRGSHAIAQLADMVIGLERNQQSEESDITQLRVLKNRFSGETGVCCQLFYNPDTGRITEHRLGPEIEF